MQTGPVWIVDNDAEDRDIVQEIWRDLQLPNELVFCKDADEAFGLLDKVETAPFIIISEVNLPGDDGFTLRERLLDTHNKKFKSVPFIFWSTQATEQQITRAYDLSV